MESSEVSIKTRSTPASLTIQGQVTKDTTVKWSIETLNSISVYNNNNNNNNESSNVSFIYV